MSEQTVKISLKPAKLIIFFFIAVAVIGGIFFFKSNSSKRMANDLKEKEIILPRETGVADSGFEGLIGDFSILNAQVIFDTRDKIEGKSSLKIHFLDQSIASVNVKNYFNNINEGNFYRLSFWAKGDERSNRKIMARIFENEKIQELGDFTLKEGGDVSYFEFVFQANNDAEDFVLTSSDAVEGDAWFDLVSVEKLDVNSTEELQNIKATIFGDTGWRNIDQGLDDGDSDSGEFLSKPMRKIGQIFQPSAEFLSGASFKILCHGAGGAKMHQLQIREFNEQLGLISDEIIASTYVNFSLRPELAEKIKKEEQQMREDFTRHEKDILEGRIENDETQDRYPDIFTQEQINASKAAKRVAKFELAVRDMKESFNSIEEIEVPLAVRLDLNKKYWIGIDNNSAGADQNNYISVITATAKEGSDESGGGFVSEVPGIWKNFETVWFRTFYPVHSEIKGRKILSGATISDIGNNKLVYRYQFKSDDYNSISGFSGRKIYDMDSGEYENVNLLGEYSFSNDDQYAIYKLDTIYAIKKIILRDIHYHQSLAIDISNDGENWEEVSINNPAENNQLIDSIVFSSQNVNNFFYLRLRDAGNSSSPLELDIEVELERSAMENYD